MPASVHKVLFHGYQILMQSVLPVRVMSEEAGESRHKFFRKDREIHSRKIGPKETMTDIYTRALATSDPVLSSFRLESRLKRKKRLVLPVEVLNMLLIPAEPEPLDSNPVLPNLDALLGDSSDDEGEEEDATGLVDMFAQLDRLTLEPEEVEN